MSFFSEKSSFKLRRDQEEPVSAPVPINNQIGNTLGDKIDEKKNHNNIQKSGKLEVSGRFEVPQANKNIAIRSSNQNVLNEKVQRDMLSFKSTKIQLNSSSSNKQGEGGSYSSIKVRNKPLEPPKVVNSLDKINEKFAGLVSSPTKIHNSTLLDTKLANIIPEVALFDPVISSDANDDVNQIYPRKESSCSAEVDENLKRLSSCMEELDNPTIEIIDWFTTKSDEICNLESSILEDDILINTKAFIDANKQINSLRSAVSMLKRELEEN